MRKGILDLIKNFLFVLCTITIYSLLFIPVSHASLSDLGNLNITGISADGSVLVGDQVFNFNQHATRWTLSTGAVDLGLLNGGNYSTFNAISANGLVLVGVAADGNAGGQQRAFYWTANTGMVSLGTFINGNTSSASAANADGSVIVGGALALAETHAFRWTQATGMVDLGTLNGGNYSSANAVNADGTVLAGIAQDGITANRVAYRWTQATGMVGLGDLNGGNFSSANAISANGLIIVGEATDGISGNNYAFRWTQATGMVSLGALNGGNASSANAISADGTVIVGRVDDGGTMRAFRWDVTNGMQTVENWLRSNGIAIAADKTLSATGVSGDGTVIVGRLDNGKGFIARLSELGSGLMTVQNALQSLSSLIPGSQIAINSANLALNGIHGHPLGNRIQNGNMGFWLAGDWNGAYKSRDRIAEVGFAKKIDPQWQVNIGLGRALKKERLKFSGKQSFDSIYINLGALGETFIKKLWLSLDFFQHWGNIESIRGYWNADILDKSNGLSKTFDKTFRARLDWDKVWDWKNLAFTPYIQHSASFAKEGAHFETNGGFPAYFNAQNYKINVSRIGLNSEMPFFDKYKFLATLEVAHQFENMSPKNSGQLVGLFNFSLPSAKIYNKNWMRGAVGFEAKIGKGVASFYANCASQRKSERTWLGASYRLSF